MVRLRRGFEKIGLFHNCYDPRRAQDFLWLAGVLLTWHEKRDIISDIHNHTPPLPKRQGCTDNRSVSVLTAMKKHNRLRKTTTNGFTLAELLIVVAIIGVLVAIGIPIFTSQLGKARAAVCLSNKTSAEHMFVIERMTDLTSTNGEIRTRVEAAVFGEAKTGCPVHGSVYTWTYQTMDGKSSAEGTTTGVRAVIQCSVAGHGSEGGNTPGGGGGASGLYDKVYDDEEKLIPDVSLAGDWKPAEFEGTSADYMIFINGGKSYYLIVGNMTSAQFKKFIGSDISDIESNKFIDLQEGETNSNEGMCDAIAAYLKKQYPNFIQEIKSISLKSGKICLTLQG